jgi:hypothetical protein
MKKKLTKKLSLNKQTVVDLHIGVQANVKAGDQVITATNCYKCTGVTCPIPTGCVPAEPTECSSPTLSERPWVCPC